MSALHDPRVRDPALLELACGLRSMIERFDRLLARHASVNASEEDVEPDEPTIVVLGLIALRDRIDRELSSAADRARVPAVSDSAPRWTGGLLR